MLFRRIIYNALLVGVLAGLLLSVIQVLAVNPLIFAAESFEVSVPEGQHAHEHGASHTHSHDENAWAPSDGFERTLYTVLANVSAGIGFTALLLAVMSQLQLQGLAQLSVPKGMVWGVAGFVVFFVAPGIGLPPEIPGIEAAPVEHRQTWWLFAVCCVGAAILVCVYAPIKYKGLCVLLVSLPYLIGAPHHVGPAFSHPDPVAVQMLTSLHQQFIVTSGISNFVFWIALGAMSAWVLNRWIVTGVQYSVNADA